MYVLAELLWPSMFVTTTSADPTAWAGVVAVIVLLSRTMIVAQSVPPIRTTAPLMKPSPLTVIVVPPLIEPLLGIVEVTLGGSGGSANVKTPFRVALSPGEALTTTSATPVPLESSRGLKPY